MVDRVTPEQRSANMRAVKGKNTGPEVRVRRFIHSRGFRFVLHDRRLPGSPDIVLPRWKTAVFVHGCYWHRHPGCSKASVPKTRTSFWTQKFERNVERDAANTRLLTEQGWDVLTVWECQTKTAEDLANALDPLLRSRARPA